MKTYTYQYDNLTVTYEMEGDVDKNHTMLQSAIDENGIDKLAEVEADKALERDIKFHCESEFGDLQWKTYIKTGEII